MFQQHIERDRKRTHLSLLHSPLSVSLHSQHRLGGCEAVVGSWLVFNFSSSRRMFPMTWPTHGSCKCPGKDQEFDLEVESGGDAKYTDWPRTPSHLQPKTPVSSSRALYWLGADLLSPTEHLPTPCPPVPSGQPQEPQARLYSSCIGAFCFCWCVFAFQRGGSLVNAALSVL